MLGHPIVRLSVVDRLTKLSVVTHIHPPSYGVPKKYARLLQTLHQMATNSAEENASRVMM